MKKKLKILAFCLAVVAFAAFFAGCGFLDDLKASQAVFSEDRKTITYQGQLYKKLPENSNIFVTGSYYSHINDVFLTEHDIPVLLSSFFSENCSYNKERDLFSLYEGYSEFYDVEYSAFVTYCNEKDYDRYLEAINNGVLDHIGVSYSVVDEDYNYSYPLVPLSDDLSAEIMAHIEDSSKMSTDLYQNLMEDYYVESLQDCLYKCDKEGLLAETLYNSDIYRNTETEKLYLVNTYNETAVELSASAYSQMKDEFFYGVYPEWDTYEDTDSFDEIGIIGSADGEDVVFVN